MSESQQDLDSDGNESMKTLTDVTTTSITTTCHQSTESIDHLIKAHSLEIKELKNQLDEVKSKSMIIETTKQDEIDEIKFRSKQEIDSLNHIIDALQTDLNSLRNDYDLLKSNLREYKKQAEKSHHHHHHHHSTAAPSAAINASVSPTSTLTGAHSLNASVGAGLVNNQQIENESLEEDMRKAKESADMLRSVVLPLETEITTLRSRSNTSEMRIKELELLIDEKEKEKRFLLEEEQNIISECLSNSIEAEQQKFNEMKIQDLAANDYFKKYIQLKKYLKKTETKFVDMEQANLKAIRQVYSMLNNDQKMRIIPTRSKKPKNSITSKIQDSNQTDEDEFNIKQNETILRIEELIQILTPAAEDLSKPSVESAQSSLTTHTTTSSSVSTSSGIHSQPFVVIPPAVTYVELLAMYEKEKLACLDMETNFQQKAKESSKQIESLNQEMNNLATIIDDLRQQYLNTQVHFQFQLDSLFKLNEDLRTELQQSEHRNEIFKNENLKLKVEIKQFQGEQTMLLKDFDDQYHSVQSIDEAQRQINSLRTEIVRLYQANQALHRQHNISLESIKHLQKSNMQYQRNSSGGDGDHMVMIQSLESELERERKVRVETENDLKDLKQQLKQVKEKSQTIVESLRQKHEQNEFEMRKLKEDNSELKNQIQSLKNESKNSLSVQEDLVRLIQSLQIELNQTKQAHEGHAISNDVSGSLANIIVVRCQHEDDFTECAACKNQFSSAKRKNRCKHCCKIFCADCCAKTVLSGPNLRPHKVCDSCHTLLDKDLKPSNASSCISSAK